MAYKESLLQWIWQELQFKCNDLHTTCGKKIDIRNNGTLNHGAGPDFLGAHLLINGLDWYGSVEIHKTANEWFRHGHHRDKQFNNVVLHVVGSEKGLIEVSTFDGSKPYTLCLRPYLQRGLYDILHHSKMGAIPCAGNVEFIHQRAFEQQIEAAHKEYFDFKVNEVIQFFPAGVPIMSAWRQALNYQMYRTLGISANKEQMGELAEKVVALDCKKFDIQGWQTNVYNVAFNAENVAGKIQWVTTGIRPPSKPQYRIKQAASCQHAVSMLSPGDYLQGVDYAWNKIQTLIPENAKPGRLMNRLMYYTVFVPSVYLLGKLLHDKTLMNQCYSYWEEQAGFVPQRMKKPFTKAGFLVNDSVKKLGLAHQYKRYCTQKNCGECKVFKNAIRA